MEVAEFNQYGKDLESIYKLRTMPVAVKFYEKAADVPSEALFPKRDLGKHMAMCQAITYARVSGITVALTKEDHWCWNPMVGLGLISCEPGEEAFDIVIKYLGMESREKAAEFFKAFPRLPLNKYEAVVLAPLNTCSFVPDVVMIYAVPDAINNMFLVHKSITGRHIKTEFDGIDSCIYSTIPSFLTGECWVTLPDPGDKERAQAAADEMILTIPAAMMPKFMERARFKPRSGPGPKVMRAPNLELDFPRPEFYNKLYELWGLETGADWEIKK